MRSLFACLAAVLLLVTTRAYGDEMIISGDRQHLDTDQRAFIKQELDAMQAEYRATPARHSLSNGMTPDSKAVVYWRLASGKIRHSPPVKADLAQTLVDSGNAQYKGKRYYWMEAYKQTRS